MTQPHEHLDPDDAAPGTELLPAPEEPQEAEQRPSALRALLSEHRGTLAPLGWMAAVDAAALTAHYATPSLGWAALTAAGASTVGAAYAKWMTRGTRLAERKMTRKARQQVRTHAKVTVAAATAWGMPAVLWTPIGPDGLMQTAFLLGGLAVAAPYWWRNRRPEPIEEAKPAAQLLPAAPVEDRRLTEFRAYFCGSGPLQDARLHDFTTVGGGFRFHVEASLARGGSYRDIKALEERIAALYDVPLDHVSVEPPENRSHRRGVVTVLTQTRAHERDEPWDGQSTYDPATGTVILGRYADGTPSRWQIHVPHSGACGGMSVGNIGSGKTGTMHVVTAEAGQARLCAVCGAEAACPLCELRRICAVWVGDPQRQPMGVWRGRADVTAWGPRSCVRMLSWLHASMRQRADFFGRMEWHDHLGRRNVGKGWFDPSPQFPMLLGVIDEWPIIAGDPELAQYAVPLLEDIGNEGRKVGAAVLLGSQGGDVDVLGDRAIRNALTAFNAAGHRGDRYVKKMLGLEGNPEDLPEGVHGVSYLRGVDQRSGIVHRTKHLPEYLRPGQYGVDVREIAERIAADPITYDPAVLNAIRPLGYTGPGQVLDDDDPWSLETLLGGTTAEAAPAAPAPPGAPDAGGLVPACNVDAVRDALADARKAEVFDLMERTGLPALDVSRALDSLITAGTAVQDTTTGRYATL